MEDTDVSQLCELKEILGSDKTSPQGGNMVFLILDGACGTS